MRIAEITSGSANGGQGAPRSVGARSMLHLSDIDLNCQRKGLQAFISEVWPETDKEDLESWEKSGW